MCSIDWNVLLEYLKVFASWPVLAFAGGVLFVRRFHTELTQLISRLEKVKAGAVEATIGAAQQAQVKSGDATFALPGETSADVRDATAAGSSPAQQQPTPHPQNAQAAIDWTVADDVKQLVPTIGDEEYASAVRWAHENPGPTVRDYVLQAASVRAERVFNVAFGTQINVLEFLRNAPGNHSLAEILPIYERHVALAAPTPTMTLVAFVLFLQNNNLVENVGPADGPLYRITAFGEWFLGYIMQFYPLTWNHRAL